ncbi:uncharacterized protein LOC135188938 [Pogoniulus pusillus]|uniref:uncharacterized protein LOC135188938 n=1 Tax=Pogoniulus pusillus TaxID=488313 RepID=UPI0030B9A2A8
MEASTWQCYGYLRDDTRKVRGRDCASSPADSGGSGEDYALLQLGQEGLGSRLERRGDLGEPRSDSQAAAKKLEMSSSGQRGPAGDLCVEDQPVSKRGCRRGEEGETPPKVYEMEVGHGRAGTGRTVKPVVYRLEESEYRRLLEEAEAEPEEEWEVTEQKVLEIREDYPEDGKVASPSLSRLNSLSGALRRQLSRSDSESSADSRQVAKLSPSCPSEGHKPTVPIRSDSFERNALLMDYLLQSKQEAPAAAAFVPWESSRAAESFRQALSFAAQPDGVPDLGHDGQAGEEALARQLEPDKQAAKSLERMFSEAANYAPVSRDTEKLLRQSSSSSQPFGSRERLEGDADVGVLESYIQKKTPPAPPVRSHSKESLALSMSKTVAMTEALLEPHSSAAKPAKEQWAAGGEEQLAGGWTAGGGGSEEPERKGWKSQEDEKVLKVADAKKTFEKSKAAEGKAAAPAPSVARKAPLVHLDPRQQGEKENKMAKGFRTG